MGSDALQFSGLVVQALEIGAQVYPGLRPSAVQARQVRQLALDHL
jgi:hypothetical protein